MGIKDDIRMPGGDRTKLNKERDRAQASMLFFTLECMFCF